MGIRKILLPYQFGTKTREGDVNKVYTAWQRPDFDENLLVLWRGTFQFTQYSDTNSDDGKYKWFVNSAMNMGMFLDL